MRAKREEQRRARELRAEGWSLRKISRALGVSLSSVRGWVRDIPSLTPPAPSPTPSPAEDPAPFRRCSRCDQMLPAHAFNRHDLRRRQWWCRECFRGYFRERGDRHREQARAAKRRRQGEGRTFVRRYLEAHPCVDCGEADVAVLEFDHLRDKEGAVSALKAAAYGSPRLAEEIAKCEVVCVNCHRRRTARRGNWWRLDPGNPPAWADHLQIRNMRHVFALLTESGCVDCGERDLVVLDFDHVGTKTANVTRLASSGYGLDRINAEVAACEVRCGNCHRRVTRARAGLA